MRRTIENYTESSEIRYVGQNIISFNEVLHGNGDENYKYKRALCGRKIYM